MNREKIYPLLFEEDSPTVSILVKPHHRNAFLCRAVCQELADKTIKIWGVIQGTVEIASFTTRSGPICYTTRG